MTGFFTGVLVSVLIVLCGLMIAADSPASAAVLAWFAGIVVGIASERAGFWRADK